ncbi:MAG: hypothetical protein ACK4WD_14005 [Flavobacteriales bacterium]|jgi:hypothetical protein
MYTTWEGKMASFPLQNPVDHLLYNALIEAVSKLTPMPLEVDLIVLDQIDAHSDHWAEALRHGRTDFLNFSVSIIYQDSEYYTYSADLFLSIPYITDQYQGPRDIPEAILGGIIINKLITVTIRAVITITIANNKMFRLSYHYNKHGRGMGYSSQKEYQAAAQAHAKSAQESSKALIYEGVYNGGGKTNGRVQRICIHDGKTSVFDKETVQLVSFYKGTTINPTTNKKHDPFTRYNTSFRY